ncbi:helix-turn-helix domain-containing protein [Actinocrispum sp. NPDC049592]|uniref:winged helix-turn-helix transcriptional regulator n=1 Tax=Actinocrispum sp. NPDC049592 TaxID=3154835 RepID=UPI00343F9E09
MESEDLDVEYDVFVSSCPSRPTLEHVTGRWGMLALGALADGPLRFNALARRVEGVSQKMLAQALQALERDGLVHRDVQTTNKLHVEYSLTPVGSEIAGKALELIGLLQARMPDILAAQARADAKTA